MSEAAEVKIEPVTSDTNEGGSPSAPAPESKELSKTNGVPSSDAVSVKCEVPQAEPAANTESTIESQDESLATEPGAAEESGPHKSRRRIKGVLNRLQDQVEFYFGDANLQKDRFLKAKIAERPDRYVSVELIASFNKMKALSKEVDLVVQAVLKSPMLELSDDKKWVRRVVPLVPTSQSDVDARTIYVENIQKSTDHNQLKKLFTPFGTVVYISLPKHKTTNVNKGFAFVEFLTADEALKAVEFFKSKEEEVPCDKSSVKNGESVFAEGKDELNGDSKVSRLEATVGKKRGRDETEETNAETRDKEASSAKRMKTEEQKTEELNVSESPDHDREQIAAGADPLVASSAAAGEIEKGSDGTAGRKRPREETNEGTDQDEDEKGAKTARLDSTLSEASAVEGEGGGDDEATRKKKRQRKHRKRKESVARQLNDLKLRVMSKSEWLEMKEIFKKMQKEEMKKLKDENKQARAKPQHSKTFVERCLVRLVNKSQEKLSREKLREVCSEYGEVAYIDIGSGENESYVRFATTGCAEKLLEAAAVLEEKLMGVSFVAVSEEEEKDYFRKTQIARKQRWSGKRKKWTRGQDKVVSQALHRQQQQASKSGGNGDERVSAKRKGLNKHIRFSDSDGD